MQTTASPWRPRPKHRERRAKARYSVFAAIRYTMAHRQLVENGLGHTVNMSSTGLLLESAHALPVGRKIELSMAWPALLNGVTGLTLRATSRTIRVQGQYTAVQILKHDFRTSGRVARKEDEARSQASA